MKIRVSLETLQPNIPGYAQIRIKNWHEATEGLKFKLQRNQDQYFLDDSQTRWSGSEHWFTLPPVEGQEDDLVFDIGQDLLDPLLETTSAAYRITVRNSAGNEGAVVLKLASGLLPSSALGQSQLPADSSVLVTPERQLIEEQVPEPVPEPEPPLVAEAAPAPVVQAPVQPDITHKKTAGAGKKIIWVLVLLLLVVLLALLAWWFLQQKNSADVTVSASATKPEVAAVKDGPCSVTGMAQENELAFIRNCLNDTTDSSAILTVIQQAKENTHCGIAQRLYANRAQSGDTAIALAYAKEYDPKFSAGNACFKEADIETAIYWYETVIENDPGNNEAKQRLEELNK